MDIKKAIIFEMATKMGSLKNKWQLEFYLNLIFGYQINSVFNYLQEQLAYEESSFKLSKNITFYMYICHKRQFIIAIYLKFNFKITNSWFWIGLIQRFEFNWLRKGFPSMLLLRKIFLALFVVILRLRRGFPKLVYIFRGFL